MLNRTLRPLPRNQFDYWKAQHLLNRAGFGGTPEQIRALTEMGLDNAVEHIVEFEQIPAEAVERDQFDSRIMRPRTEEERQMLARARQSGDETIVEQYRQEREQRQAADRQQIVEMKKWWLKRMIMTPRPLQEKLTLFLHGHFATGYRTIEDSYHMFMQNQLFRAHATGNFKQLTHAIIKDPAMIRYLNNNQNNRRAPNENLARELMELFTLGEGNVYSENDIKQGARALTGYTYYDDEFRFNDRNHDTDPKRILGAVGNFDGDDLVNLIYRHKEVSQFICWKLYRYFVNDLPGEPDRDRQEFILNIAEQFRKSDYEFRPVLKALFQSAHFYDESNVAAVVKSPIQLIVQAVRSFHTPARDLGALLSAAALMGQNIFEPPSVKGWEGGRAWINTATLFVRQNTLVYLLTGKRPNVYDWQADTQKYDPSHLVSHLQNESSRVESDDAVQYLLRFCLGQKAREERTRVLQDFVRSHGGRIDNDMTVALLSLITAMPEYQLC